MNNNLYNRNGLLFWSQEQIRLRNMFAQHILAKLEECLKIQNKAFEFVQIEAPILNQGKNYL